MSLFKLAGVAVAAVAALLLLVNSSSGFALIAAFALVAVSVWYAEHSTMSHMMPFDRAVLITGCDTGFGYELAHHLDSMGMVVFAGCLDKDGEGAKNLRDHCSERTHVLQMDITSDDQVAAAVEYIGKHLPRAGLHGVINNAGLNHHGEVECTPMNQYETMTQINLLGMVRVTKATLPLIRQHKGRYLNMSSVRGELPLPYSAAYTMCKYAVEGFSDILRLEMRKWGVKVVIIQPGHFGGATQCLELGRLTQDYTAQWEQSSEEVKKAYGKDYIIDGYIQISKDGAATSSMSIFPVIAGMTDALLAIKPKLRYRIGGSRSLCDVYTWTGLVRPFVPTAVMDWFCMWLAGGFPVLPKDLRT